MRQFLNPHTLANDVRMRRALFKGAFLFVEGESDEKFYCMFVNSELCQIIISHNRQNVCDAVRILYRDRFAGAVGIVDADFDNLEHISPDIPALFMTDLHDIECSMILSPAFDKLLFEFGSRFKIENWKLSHNPDIRQHILSQAVFVGYAVWYSNRMGLNLKFETLEPKDFVDQDCLEINIHRLVQNIKNKSQRHDISDEELIAAITELHVAAQDFWQLVRGHDFIDFLSFAFHRTLGTCTAQTVARERLESSLRMAYSNSDFLNTQLYISIREWEHSNAPYQIIRSN